MRRSILLFLCCSLCLLLVCCKSYQLGSGYEERLEKKDVWQNRFFADAQQDYVYKANIRVYGHELTGVLIIKKISEDAHRVAFTTEFGNKLLDFEVSQTDFRVNTIVEELNRKMLLKVLKKDFSLLLRIDFPIAQAFQKGADKVYKSNEGPNSHYIFVSGDGEKPTELRFASRTKEKIKIGFTAENNIFASTISIRHLDMPLQMDFEHFKEN